MCYQYPRVPNFTPFRYTTSHFSVTGHFEKSAPNDPKWPWTLEHYQLKCTPYVLLVSLIPKFHYVLLYSQPLRYRVVWDKCTEWPQNNLEPYKVKLPHICITTILWSQISRRFTLWPASLRYKSFWDKCTEWPQIDLEPYMVKLPYICINGVPDSQISLRFTVLPALFEI